MAETFRLPEQLQRTLDRLSALPELDEYYLAGGTAVAAHLQHRVSRDLDFFSRGPDVSLARVKIAAFRLDPSARVVTETDVALHLRFDGVPVDFVRYPYPPWGPLWTLERVKLASPTDLAVMKLVAIARRGIRRDFWDLYALLQAKVGLNEAMDAYQQRFGLREADLYHVLRALTYFEDAEREPTLPAGMSPELWLEIRSFFLREAPRALPPR